MIGNIRDITMKTLFLGYKDCFLHSFLKDNCDVVDQSEDKLYKREHNIKKYDLIVSFGYCHIIRPWFIKLYKDRIINLHISYLPHGRGRHPIFWAAKNGHPQGITIHLIDSGIDTGEILYQEKIVLNQNTTFKQAHGFLLEKIQHLFIKNWVELSNALGTLRVLTTPQSVGNYKTHKVNDLELYKHMLKYGWETKMADIVNSKKRTDDEIIDQLELVRRGNNVNWMNLVRLAFRENPQEARQVFATINKLDNEIANLLKELADND